MRTRTFEEVAQHWTVCSSGTHETIELYFLRDIKVTEKDGVFTGKVTSRFVNIPAKQQCELGTPSKLHTFLKKFGIDFNCVSEDNSQINDCIDTFKKEIFEEKKTSFLNDLRSILKKNGLSMSMNLEYGGWGEAWAESALNIRDTLTGWEDSILEDNEDFE